MKLCEFSLVLKIRKKNVHLTLLFLDRIDDGCVDSHHSPEFCGGGPRGIDLQQTTTFEILQHGCFMCADGRRAGDALIDAERKFHAQAFCNGLCFQHHGPGHSAGSGGGINRLQGGTGQCAAGIKILIAPWLFE